MDPVQAAPVLAAKVVLDALPMERGAQARLARLVGTTPQTVNKWINGTLPIRPNWYTRIEDALDLPRFTLAQETLLYQHYGLDQMPAAKAEKQWARLFPEDEGESSDRTTPVRPTTSGIEDRLSQLERRVAAIEGATSSAEAERPDLYVMPDAADTGQPEPHESGSTSRPRVQPFDPATEENP